MRAIPLANPWNSYRQVATQTAPPGQLVLMLFEGALRFMHRAMDGFAKDDPSEANEMINNNVLRAQEILRELDGALDLANGGEFATTMHRLYNYFDDRLQQSNLRKHAEGISEVIRHVTVLRDAWETMLRNGGAEAVPAPAAPGVAA
jgi:flagellar secretion chaperone FliS